MRLVRSTSPADILNTSVPFNLINLHLFQSLEEDSLKLFIDVLCNINLS
jgi:hypothetical protein